MEILTSSTLASRKKSDGTRAWILRARIKFNRAKEKWIEIRPSRLDGTKISFAKDMYSAKNFGQDQEYVETYDFLFKTICRNYVERGVVPNKHQLQDELFKTVRKHLVKKSDLDKLYGVEDDFSEKEWGEVNRLETQIIDQSQLIDDGTETTPDEIAEIASINVIVNENKNDDWFKYATLNKQNIFYLFCLGHEKSDLNKRPKITKEYHKLLKCLHDYRVNSEQHVPRDVSNLNRNWIDNFFIFLRDFGYAKFKSNMDDPFEWFNVDDKLKNAERSFYSISSFKNVLKWTKRYLTFFMDSQLVMLDFAPSSLKANEYLTSQSLENYTRQAHHLNTNEIEELIDTQFESEIMENARVLFLAMFCFGGLRISEIMDERTELKMANNEVHLEIYAKKSKKYNENPIFPQFEDRIYTVLKSVGFTVPSMREDELRTGLRMIAKQLGWERQLTCYKQTTKMVDSLKVKKPLYEVICPYFARKTFVTLAIANGFNARQVMSFTNHSREQTLSHYAGGMTLDQKRNFGDNK